MDLWIKELTSRLDRRKADILFGEHAAKDKNLNLQDIDKVTETIRIGKIDESKSTETAKRICFKNYFKEKEASYFVIAEYYPEFVKIVTVIKKKGKY